MRGLVLAASIAGLLGLSESGSASAGAARGALSHWPPNAGISAPSDRAHIVGDVLSTPRRALRAIRATAWNGGTYSTPNGQRVTLYLHGLYRFESSELQNQANWLATYLYYASELPRATFFIVPPGLVAFYCEAEAYGCYEPSSGSLILPGENLADGTHWMSVLAHEYGHHVAWSRSNPPWIAGLWGPKRWASYVQVCARVANGSAIPGGQGGLYWSDPGEVFAETYARAVNRNGNWQANWWPVWSWHYDPTFAPSGGAIAAAQQDAQSPYAPSLADQWTGKLSRQKVRVKRNGRWRLEARGRVLPKSADYVTELDGVFHAALEYSPGANLLVLDAESGRLLAPPGPVSSFTICGQRNVRLRVVSSRPGAFSVTITRP